jgi:flagellar biosynthesis protein FlhF
MSTPPAPYPDPPYVYCGRTVEELIPKIQAELGDDAIVVRRRKGLTGGIGGFFQRPFVEIEAQPGSARIDLYDDYDAAPALPQAPPEPVAHQTYAAPEPMTPHTYASRELAAHQTHSLQEPTTHHTYLTQEPMAYAPDLDDEFSVALAAAEAEGVEQAVVRERAVAGEQAAVAEQTAIAELTDVVDPELFVEHPAEISTAEHLDVQRSEPTTIGAGWARAGVERSLLDVGVDQDFVDELIGAALAHTLALNPRLSLARAVRRTLLQWIPVCRPLPGAGATIALVGPGGAGKTACCAALLGSYRRGGALPVACATIVQGAAGELAMLLSPHVLEPTAIADPDASRALCKAREEGILLLDMPPLSPADRPAIDALAALLDELGPDRVAVALPATLGAKPAAQLLQALRPLRPSALAITHADATDQLGVAVQAACRFGLAPEYLLDRAGGHGGLTPIDPTYLADRLLS